MNRTIRPIGHIHTLFPEKFGLPRQSSLKEELLGALTLDGEYARSRPARRSVRIRSDCPAYGCCVSAAEENVMNRAALSSQAVTAHPVR